MSELKPPPYPADTRAKGWRFEIDYEKVDQSDTWSLASEIPMAQPALLMMWLAAWTQEPCGSLPNDLGVIRTKCKVPVKLWPSLQGVLMRGWWLAEDGRLYHDTLTARVLEMLEYRRKNAERVANFKAKQRELREGNALPTGEQLGKNDTGTGTGTSSLRSEKTPKAPRKRRAAAAQGVVELVQVEALIADGVDPKVAADWMAIRAAKNLPLTDTAWSDTKDEAVKAGMGIGDAIRYSVVRARGGFRSSWITSDAAPGPVATGGGTTRPNKQEALEQRNRAVGQEWARRQKEIADAQ